MLFSTVMHIFVLVSFWPKGTILSLKLKSCGIYHIASDPRAPFQFFSVNTDITMGCYGLRLFKACWIFTWLDKYDLRIFLICMIMCIIMVCTSVSLHQHHILCTSFLSAYILLIHLPAVIAATSHFHNDIFYMIVMLQDTPVCFCYKEHGQSVS